MIFRRLLVILIIAVGLGAPELVLASSRGMCFRYYDSNLVNYVNSLGTTKKIKFFDLASATADFQSNAKIDLVHQSLIELSEIVGELTKSNNPRTVIYPASGFDGNTAFMVFKKATTVIGIDGHEFLHSSADSITPSSTLSERSINQGWVKYSEIDQQRFVGPALVGSIMAIDPSIRILSISNIQTKDKKSHGIIEFDNGDFTPVKRYIHIQSIDVSEVIFPILDHEVKAVFLKASMDFFDESVNPQNRVILDVAKKNHALLVDGDGVMSYALWPYIEKDSVSSQLNSFNKPKKVINTHIQKLGYDETYVVQF